MIYTLGGGTYFFPNWKKNVFENSAATQSKSSGDVHFDYDQKHNHSADSEK